MDIGINLSKICIQIISKAVNSVIEGNKLEGEKQGGREMSTQAVPTY